MGANVRLPLQLRGIRSALSIYMCVRLGQVRPLTPTLLWPGAQSANQSGAAAPHSKTWPFCESQFALACWSAALLRRFGLRVAETRDRRRSAEHLPLYI